MCIWSTGQEDRFLNQPGQEPIKSPLSHFNLQYCHIFVINFCLGDVLLSLNKLDLNSSNVHTILAAITGPMEVSNFFLCISWMRWLFNYLQISMLPNNFKVALNVLSEIWWPECWPYRPLCCVLGKDVLLKITVVLPTQKYKWVLADLMLEKLSSGSASTGQEEIVVHVVT